MGLIQLVHGSPATPPAGYPARRDRTGDRAQAVGDQHRRRGEGGAEVAAVRVRNTVLRNAKLEPRSTMPNAAKVSGTNRVSVMEA